MTLGWDVHKLGGWRNGFGSERQYRSIVLWQLWSCSVVHLDEVLMVSCLLGFALLTVTLTTLALLLCL